MKKKARIDLLETQLIEAKNQLLGCKMAARSNLAALRKSWQIDLGHLAALEAGLAKLEGELVKYKQDEEPVGGVHFNSGKVHVQNAFDVQPVMVRNVFDRESE